MHGISALRVCAGAWVAWLAYWYAAALWVKKTKVSEGAWVRLQHTVPLGFGAWLIFHGSDRPLVWGTLYHSTAIAWCGVGVAVLGLAFSVWARVHLGRNWSGIITLKEGHQLIRSGPYAWVRHPIYTGFLGGALGTAMAAATGDAFVGVAVVLVAFLVKISREEALMGSEFGAEYERFKREVPALVPGLRGFGARGPGA